MKILQITTIICVLFVFTVAGKAQELRLPKDVIVGKLENGLTYYLVPNGDRGKVRLTMVSKAGALVEKPEEHGYAHILEHLMADGTKHFPGKSSVKEMDNMGMRRGKEMSAFTSMNYTQYNLIIPPHQNEYFRRCLTLFKDWAFYLEVDSTILENEKKVILEEIRMGGKGNATAFFFDGTELEGHDLLGDRNDIKSATVQSLIRFYQKIYRPDLLAIIVYGDIDVLTAKKHITEVFGSIPSPVSDVPALYPDLTAGNRMAFGKPLGITAETELKLVAKRQRHSIVTETDFREKMISAILIKMMEGRFRQPNLKSISSGRLMITGSLPTTEFMSFVLKLASKSFYKDQLNDFSYVMAQIRQHGFSQEEIAYYAAQQIEFFSRNKASNRFEFEDFQNYFLIGDVPLNGFQRFTKTEQLIKTLKSADFEDFLDNFLKADKLIHLDSTSKAYTPEFTLQYVLDKFAGIDSLKTQKFVFKTPSIPSTPATAELNFPAVNLKASPIIQREVIDSGIQKLTLKNGLTIILHQTGSDKLLFKMMGNGGLNLIPETERNNFTTYEKYLTTSYGGFNAKEIFNFERINSIYLSNEIKDVYFANIVKGNSSSFEKLCQVFYNSLVNPTKATDAEFAKSQEKVINLANRKKAVENDSTEEVSTKEIITAETQHRFFNYMDQILRNFSSSILYISGNLPENATELIAKYIATIPCSGPSKLAVTKNPSKPDKGIVFKENKWKRKSSLVSFMFKGKPNKKINLKDELILEAIAELVNIKMLDSLREKHGLVYATGITATVKKYPTDAYSLNFRYMIDSINIPRSKEIMLRTLKDLKLGNIENNALEQLKAILVSKYLTGYYDEDQLEENWLKLNLKYGKVFTWNHLNKIISTIKPDEIKQAMFEIFDFENYGLTYFISPQ